MLHLIPATTLHMVLSQQRLNILMFPATLHNPNLYHSLCSGNNWIMSWVETTWYHILEMWQVILLRIAGLQTKKCFGNTYYISLSDMVPFQRVISSFSILSISLFYINLVCVWNRLKELEKRVQKSFIRFAACYWAWRKTDRKVR